MSNSSKKSATKPRSVRFTEAEEARINEKAAGRPISLYIRECVLADDAEPRARRRSPTKDEQALAAALALLGQTRISSNLNQLAKAANTGSLPVTAETEADLRAACAQVMEIRCLILRALGFQILESAISPMDAFNAGGAL